MTDVTLDLEHSVEADVSLAFAWRFAIEMPLDRATLRFEWYFDVAAGGGTKLTQRIVLSGINAAAYREQVEAGFRPTLADGMRRLAADMVAADRDLKDAG